VTYRYPDGTLLGGVEAIAAALSHLHLGWAWLGWLIRLPIILPLSEIAFGNAFSNRSRCELDI
jgi:predicted DCC family thiol-disulfide oxidoreductase YuxK